MHIRVKSVKNFLEERNREEDSSKTTISYLSTLYVVGSSIPKRKKISRQQQNLCQTKISVEVHGM